MDIQICDQVLVSQAMDNLHIQEAIHRGSNVSEITGTSLGLAVVKACLELHRGTWSIDSHSEQGTTVTVKLPLE